MSLLSGINFIPNPMGIAMIARSTMMETMLKGAAEAIAEVARKTAPTDVEEDSLWPELDPTPYREQITVASGVKEGVVMARVNANKFTSNWLEFGAGPSPYRHGLPFPPRAILRRAAETVGLRLVSKK